VTEAEREVGAAADRALAARSLPDTACLYVYSPAVDPSSSAFASEPAGDGKPDTMVAAITGRSRTRWRATRSSSSSGGRGRLQSRGGAGRGAGQGGVFKVTHGLQRTYGSARVFNSPLAEANIVGRAIGWPSAASSPSSRSSSSTTSGRR